MKEDYYVVSFSGGKDSTAMLLRMLELEMKIDEVVNCDTYMEFSQMYNHIEVIKNIIQSKGIKFVTLRNPLSFKYLMLEHQPKRRIVTQAKINGNPKGYSWADSRSRWCTSKLKTDVIKRYLRQLNEKHNVIQYVGIATDETYRLERESNKKHKHPLVDWGWTEADALKYCYDKGFDFGGLYEIFDRVSCWCCPLQSLEDLRNLRKHFPELWDELREMDNRTWRQFRRDFSVQDLEIRFQLEEEWDKKGLSTSGHSKAFRAELKQRLNK